MDKAPEARPGSLEVLHDASVTWRHIAPAGITLEDCQRSDYWANVIREVSQQRVNGRHSWNRIEILAEDGSWEAELRVMAVGVRDVTTRLLREWRAAAPVKGRKVQPPEGYKVEHIPANGWRVLDHKNFPVATNLATEDEAIARAQQHAKRAA